MVKVRDGFYRQVSSTVGSDSYLLKSGGGYIGVGNANGNVPLSNGTVNTNLNADLLDGKHYNDIISDTDNKYVKKTGDTMTGNLDFNSGGIRFNMQYGYIMSTNSSGWICFMPSTYTNTLDSPLRVNIAEKYIDGGESGTTSLGTSSRRWSNIYSVLGNFSGQITSTVATGTAPLKVTSTTVVTNLNADLLDGKHYNDIISDINGKYVLKTGDTMTGNLIIQKSSGSPAVSVVNDSYKLSLMLGSGGTNRGIYDDTAAEWVMYRGSSSNIFFPSGNIGIGNTSPSYKLHVTGTGGFTGQLTLSVATGTAPLKVTSTTAVTNLNADMLDGKHASDFLTDLSLSNYVTLNTAQTITAKKTFSVQQAFTVADGTAPFTVTSKTAVTNLNADMLDGKHASDFLTEHQSLANYVTLNTAQTITAKKTFSVQQAFTVATGTSPFTVTSTTAVTNLNADMLDGKHASAFLTEHQSLANYVTLNTAQTITAKKTFSVQQAFTVATGTSPFTVTSTTMVSNLNADLLDGQHGDYYRKQNLLFTRVKSASASDHADPDVDLAGGGMLYNYSSTSAWDNMPSGMSYGQVIMLASAASPNLSAQLAWDVNHNSETPTRRIWWRAGSSSHGFKNDWHLILDSSNYGTTLDGIYVKKTGDTMTGTLTMPAPSSAISQGIKFGTVAHIGASGSLYLYSTGNICLRTEQSSTTSADSTKGITFTATSLYSAVTNTVSNGTSSYRWSNTYSVLGNFSGQITSTVATGTAPFKVTSTTAVTNLNADMLDGIHSSGFAKKGNATSGQNIDEITSEAGFLTVTSNSYAVIDNGFPAAQAGLLIYGTGAYSGTLQIYGTYSSNKWYARGGGKSGDSTYHTAWREFLFTDSTITATKLATVRKLWGQDFDGTKDVSGNMTGVGTVAASGTNTITTTTAAAIFRAKNNNGSISLQSDSNRGVYDDTKSRWLVGTDGTNSFLMGGNVGIGTTTPTSKLHVKGNALLDNGDSAVYLDMYRNGINYIRASRTDGTIAFITNGLSGSKANSTLFLEGKNAYPGTTNVSSLGTSSYRWSNTYSVLGNFSGQVTLSVATGTAPLKVTSTTLVSNLNSDKLDGYEANTIFETLSYSGSTLTIKIGGATKTATINSSGDGLYVLKAGDTMTGALTVPTTLTISSPSGGANYLKMGRPGHNYIQATESGGGLAFLTDGASSSSVANSTLRMVGKDVYPGTTNVGSLGLSSYRWSNTYSVLGNFSGQVTLSVATGTAPLKVTSTTKVANLNADRVDDLHFTVVSSPGTDSNTIYIIT